MSSCTKQTGGKYSGCDCKNCKGREKCQMGGKKRTKTTTKKVKKTKGKKKARKTGKRKTLFQRLFNL